MGERPEGPQTELLAELLAAAIAGVVDGVLSCLALEGVEVSGVQRRRAVNRLLYGVPYSPAEERATARPLVAKPFPDVHDEGCS